MEIISRKPIGNDDGYELIIQLFKPNKKPAICWFFVLKKLLYIKINLLKKFNQHSMDCGLI